MTLSSVRGELAQGQLRGPIPDAAEASLAQATETGDLVPNSYLGNGLITKQNAPAAKPWAHFVAGA